MSKNIKTTLIIFMSFFLILSVTVFIEKSLTKESSCTGISGTTHTAVIQNNIVVPSETTAKLCDTLTITNNDTATRLIAFGQHENHIIYDGKGETALNQNQSMTIVLSKKGTFVFHDHDDEKVGGSFTVN